MYFFFIIFLGSPFSVNVGGQGSGRLTESILRERRAVDITHIGSQCELSLKIPGTYCSTSSIMLFFLLVSYFVYKQSIEEEIEKCLKEYICLVVYIRLEHLLSVVSPTTSLGILSLMMLFCHLASA